MQPWCGYNELIILNPSRVVLRLCSNSVQVFEPFVSILIGKNSQRFEPEYECPYLVRSPNSPRAMSPRDETLVSQA